MTVLALPALALTVRPDAGGTIELAADTALAAPGAGPELIA